MKILVTGLNRSGTSVMAHLLSRASQKSLLDDPDWAYTDEVMAAAYRRAYSYRMQLENHHIVKCPRMAEILPLATDDFPGLDIVFMFRDPRDVYCSILEKKQTGFITRMLDNSRFGSYEEAWEGVALAFNYYARRAFASAQGLGRDRMILVCYEDFFFAKEATISGVCKRFNLGYSGESFTSVLGQQFGPFRNKSPFDQSIKGVGRWRRELPYDIADAMYDMTNSQYSRLRELSLSK